MSNVSLHASIEWMEGKQAFAAAARMLCSKLSIHLKAAENEQGLKSLLLFVVFGL